MTRNILMITILRKKKTILKENKSILKIPAGNEFADNESFIIWDQWG